MKFSIFIFSAFISWAIYDPQFFRRKSGLAATELYLFAREEESEAEREVKAVRVRSVIPPQKRQSKRSRRQRPNPGFSTKPKDVRFSNQRKIRRMFNNL